MNEIDKKEVDAMRQVHRFIELSNIDESYRMIFYFMNQLIIQGNLTKAYKVSRFMQ